MSIIHKKSNHQNNSISFFDKGLVILFVISKIITISLFLFFFYTNPEYYSIANLGNSFYTGKEILAPFANWDGQSYLLIAEKGYNELESSHAFYPLYPMAIKAINVIINNFYISAFFINIVFSYLFSYFLYRFSCHYFSRKKSLWILSFVLCFPTAFYMTAFYTEALFMALLFGFLYYYVIEKSNKSLIFLFLMPLCRGQGFFVFGAIIIYLFTEYLKSNKVDWKRQYYNLAGFLGGALTYFLFFYFVTGNAFSSMEAQEKYFSANKNSIRNIFNPNYFIEYLFSSVNTSPPSERNLPPEYYDYFNLFFGWVNNILVDKLFIIVSLFSLYFVYKTKNTLWVLLYFMLLYPVASMGVGTSFTRFALTFSPILALALWKNYSNKKEILYGITFLLLCIQVYFIYRFSLGMWVA